MLGRVGSSLAAKRVAPALRAAANVRSLHATAPSKKQEEPLPQSWVEKFNLTDPTRYVPLTIGGFSFASLTGIYHFDAESQLLALWVLFCGTVYSRGGPLLAEMLDETKNDIAKEHKAIEDAEIAAVKVAMEAHKRQTAVFEDIKHLFEGGNALMNQSAASAQNELRLGVREAFIKQLDTIVNLEANTSAKGRKVLVEKATASVKNAYLSGSDASLKNKAIDAAIAALSNPQGAKKDSTVADLYTKFFGDVKQKVNNATGKPFELSESEFAEIKESIETIARRDGIDPAVFPVPKTATLNA